MKAKILKAEQIKNCEGRDYNPQVWERNVNKIMSDYKDVIFYHVPKGDGYDYDRYFVEYTLPDGLRLLNRFSYSFALTSGGFFRVDKNKVTADGKSYVDVLDLYDAKKVEEAKQLASEIDNSEYIDIEYGKFHHEPTNKMVVIDNSKEGRQWMIERSQQYGTTFSKG